MPKIVILGGGVGGTLVANRLARRRLDLEITVVDGHGDHLYQPGFLRVPFGARTERLACDARALLHPSVRLLVARVEAVEREKRRVIVETGRAVDYDGLVIATGSRLDHDRLPGGREVNHHFHCRAGAERLREALDCFSGGRIVVGAASLPYKCPPSPIEFTLLLDRWLRRRRLRAASSLTYVYPLEDIIPLPPVARVARPLLEKAGVEIVTGFAAPAVDPGRRIVASNGRAIAFDLLILVPPHAGAPFLNGWEFADPHRWVRTDPRTLRVTDRIYALGDATNLPRPKSGSVAHFQSRVVAENVLAEIDGRAPEAAYDGRVMCFLETGGGRATTVEFNYERPPDPAPPNRLDYWKKALFGRYYFRILQRL